MRRDCAGIEQHASTLEKLRVRDAARRSFARDWIEHREDHHRHGDPADLLRRLPWLVLVLFCGRELGAAYALLATPLRSGWGRYWRRPGRCWRRSRWPPS